MTLLWNIQYAHPKKKGGCLAGLERGKWYVDYIDVSFFMSAFACLCTSVLKLLILKQIFAPPVYGSAWTMELSLTAL